jgi:DNA-binding transcriptional MerR regulator
MYRIQQFADLSGVTVRALRHYDRLGILKPGHRSAAGYRLYVDADLARLERILVLRTLGLSLHAIGAVLRQLEAGDAARTLDETLAAQAALLRERRDGLTRVLYAVERAQHAVRSGAADWTLFQTILKEINMQETMDWAKKYYSEDAQQAVAESEKQWDPALQDKISADWAVMYADVESAMARGVETSSTEAKTLADRWMALVGQFTQGNPAMLEGLNKLYQDRDNWPKGIQDSTERNLPKPELMQWIRSVQNAHKAK